VSKNLKLLSTPTLLSKEVASDKSKAECLREEAKREFAAFSKNVSATIDPELVLALQSKTSSIPD